MWTDDNFPQSGILFYEPPVGARMGKGVEKGEGGEKKEFFF